MEKFDKDELTKLEFASKDFLLLELEFPSKYSWNKMQGNREIYKTRKQKAISELINTEF